MSDSINEPTETDSPIPVVQSGGMVLSLDGAYMKVWASFEIKRRLGDYESIGVSGGASRTLPGNTKTFDVLTAFAELAEQVRVEAELQDGLILDYIDKRNAALRDALIRDVPAVSPDTPARPTTVQSRQPVHNAPEQSSGIAQKRGWCPKAAERAIGDYWIAGIVAYECHALENGGHWFTLWTDEGFEGKEQKRYLFSDMEGFPQGERFIRMTAHLEERIVTTDANGNPLLFATFAHDGRLYDRGPGKGNLMPVIKRLSTDRDALEVWVPDFKVGEEMPLDPDDMVSDELSWGDDPERY